MTTPRFRTLVRALGALLAAACADGAARRETEAIELRPAAAPRLPADPTALVERPDFELEPRPAVVVLDPRPDAPGTAPSLENAPALAPFLAALARTEAGGAITRVTHLGDSSIGMDGLPHFLRLQFQARFGDAGPGFVLLQAPSPDYRNQTLSLSNPRAWDDLCFIIRRCRRDGHYGLGGVTVEGHGGAQTLVRPADQRAVARAELWYAEQPRGGRIALSLGDARAEIDTRGAALADRWHVLRRDDPGPHPVRVIAVGGGPVRAYGVALENDGPGVVWDSLSMIGAFTHRLLAHDEAHFARQLARRAPDLVVLSYGGNDLRRVVHGVDGDGLRRETAALLARVRAAAPGAGCLVLGINDHLRSGEADVRIEHVQAVLGAQRAAAQGAGCAFWDTTAAMGGPGSFERWRRLGMAADDGKHLSARGRRVIADRLFAALMAELAHRAPTEHRGRGLL